MGRENRTCKKCSKRFHACGSCALSHDYEEYYCCGDCWVNSDEYKETENNVISIANNLSPDNKARLKDLLEDCNKDKLYMLQDAL